MPSGGYAAPATFVMVLCSMTLQMFMWYTLLPGQQEAQRTSIAPDLSSQYQVAEFLASMKLSAQSTNHRSFDLMHESTGHRPYVTDDQRELVVKPSMDLLMAQLHHDHGQMSKADAYNYYNSKGYIIHKQLIPHDLIDEVHFYLNQLKGENPVLKRQGGKTEKNKLNDFGYMTNTILDLHAYTDTDLKKKLATAVRNVFLSDQIAEALAYSTNDGDHLLFQTMYFEYSHVPPHQDYYYLDSVPSGRLSGVWIALEDMDPDGILPFVVPGLYNTTAVPKTWEEHHAINHWLGEKIGENGNGPWRDSVVRPVLKKGDVFFWNSFVVHGSLVGPNKRCTRKSLVGHMTPTKYGFQQLFVPGNTYENLPKSAHNGKLYVDPDKPRSGPGTFKQQSLEYTSKQNDHLDQQA